MASLRKSPRTASPVDTSQMLPSTAVESSMQGENGESAVGLQQQQQPLLRPPPTIPNLEDPRSNGRPVGMRDGMSQFRTNPTPPKSKLKVKQYDPARRSYFARNDDGSDGRDTPKGLEKNAAARRPVVERSEENTTKQSSYDGKKEDEADATPTSAGTLSQPKQSPTATSLPQPTVEDFPRSRVQNILGCAVQLAREKKSEILGRALESVYQESLDDPNLYQLFTLVLIEQASPEDTTEFNKRVNMARRSIKKEQKKANMASNVDDSKSSSKSSSTADSLPDTMVSKPVTKSPGRRTRAAARSELASHANEEASTPTPQPSQVNGKRSHHETNKTDEPPSKRTRRSGSVSSTSSLSSVHSLDIDPDLEMSDEQRSSRIAGKKGTAAQPPKGHLGSKAPPKKPYGSLAGPKLGKETAQEESETTEREAKKRKLMRTEFEGYHVEDSDIRDSPKPSLPQLKTDTSFPNLSNSTSSARGKKRDFDDLRSPASSAHDELLVPPPPEARRSSRSRGVTPNVARTRGGAVTTERSKARIKESPRKKNGVVAGIAPRSTRAKDAGAEQSDDDEDTNSEYCAACGGQGRLLCCDGCPRSFHFYCLDPPQVEEDQAGEEYWYCHNCEGARDPQVREPQGLWSQLRSSFNKQNPVAYALPKRYRDYYEGVATGEDGEYVDVAAGGKTKNTKVPGYDEEKKPDNLKLKDKKNQVILCFKCGGSSLGKREIIPCDYCGFHWHLDCLNPPLANPPFRDPQNRAKYRWMCPAHADRVLTSIGESGRRYKTRRPKNAQIVDTDLRRGFKSNGLVEVELDPSDEEIEIDDEPRIYRVTERSIRLDFYDNIRREIEEQGRQKASAERIAQEDAEKQARIARQAESGFRTRSIIEKEALVALCDLAGKDVSVAVDEVKELVETLLKEAPDDILATLDERPRETPAKDTTSGPPSPPDSDPNNKRGKTSEIRQLLLLQELVGQKLKEIGHS